MRTDATPTAPDTPDDIIITVGERATNVLHAMLFGEYGDRVRSYAQAEVGRAWTEQQLADAPGVLTAVLDQLRTHMHAIHVGRIAERIAIQLLTSDHEPPDSYGLDDDHE